VLVKCSDLMTFIYNTPVNFNTPKLSFRSMPVVPQQIQPKKDSFTTNPLYEGVKNADKIENLARNNPKIKAIMDKYNLPIKANTQELSNLQKGHLKDTRIIVAKMYSALPEELKKEVDLKQIQEAAMLHDYGKVLIPQKILNKKDKLTELEREIIQQHSEIGYELLQNIDIDEETLNLIKYHHQTPTGNGYPALDKSYKYGVENEMVSIADKYSALTENRAYKPAMSKEEALDVIKEDVAKGIFSQEIYSVLEKSV